MHRLQVVVSVIKACYISLSGPGSSVGMATDYRLDDPGIESR